MTHPLTRRAALILTIAGVSTSARAHGIHAAFTEITVDGDDLAVMHRMFTQDITVLMAARSNAQVTTAHGPAFDAALDSYLHDVFILTDRAGARLPLRWLRAEVGPETVIARQSLAGGAALGAMIVDSQILTETNQGQVNTVNLTRGGKTRTVVCTAGSKPQTLGD